MTRKDIEKLNAIEPYCFETDREEQWYQVGLREGLEIADSHPKSPWISVEDDLPCNHKELISLKDETETIPVIANIGGIIGITKMVKNSHTNKWVWATQVTVYHWMPNPELPKE